jgi:hypothetical protein
MQERSIEDWCIKLDLKNYSIDNGVVNVKGTVLISRMKLEKIPVQFGIVVTNFFCSTNKLISLDGSPKEIYGDFNCKDNMLKSLKGGPLNVNGGYYCQYNKLISLDGSPEKIGRGIICFSNPIYQVCELFGNYERYKASLDYNYLRGTNIVGGRFKKACEDAEIEMPDYIPGYNII